MFDGADVHGDEAVTAHLPQRAPRAAQAQPIAMRLPEAVPPVAPSRYGESRGFNLPAIIVTAAIHVIALAAVLLVRYEAPPAKPEQRLVTVNLTPPPPPPSPETPPPSAPDIVAPRAPIQIARVPLIATTPDPVPHDPSPVAAPAPSPSPPVAVPAPPTTVQVSDLSVRMLSGAPPRYPVESRRKKEQGTVLLSLTVGTDGRVASIAVSRSSGFDRLDQAALSAVRKWRWAPLVQDGTAVKVKGVVEIPFVLVS